MDYSAANTYLWTFVGQIGTISVIILIANVIRRKISFIRKSLMPTAVLGGFILLAAKLMGIVKLDLNFMEAITYHSIAIGFIALSLRVPEATEIEKEKLTGLKSGAAIVSSYMIQAIFGLLISVSLSLTIMPNMFRAAGILLPLGYGQGPGQANNTGGTYELTWGFVGGRSYGLAIAAAGYLCACIVGVIIMNVLVKQGKIKRKESGELSGSVTVDNFQSENEAPVAESIDRLSLQMALIIVVYLVTFLITKGITGALSSYAPGVGNMLNSLLWGFNFMIGSGLAILTRTAFKGLNKTGIMRRQYQNNYLLSRISGLAFDFMIVAGIASISIDDLKGLWLPFILMAVIGGIVTLANLTFICKKIYKDYFYEGLLSMYGMMTGTISSGVLLLREIDPNLSTPAAGNLVVGSSFAILLGAPLLVLVGMAPQNNTMTWLVLGLVIIYYLIMLGIIHIKPKEK